MIHKTKGIVLRTVRYGETSVIVSIYTELFGLQSYIINGIRTSSKKKGSAKGNLFQPAAILDLIVYHNELKNLQRIKEFSWSYLYKRVFFDVLRNAVASFMVELLQKCVRQPEAHAALFSFAEDAFMSLDETTQAVLANYPLFFSLHIASFFGFRITDNYSDVCPILDLQEGFFVKEKPIHDYFLDGKYSFATSQLLKTMQPIELVQVRLNQDSRRILLDAYQTFFALHIPEFGTMRSLPVLQELFS
ncbi:MAG TPA: DNA repair protein RecO [Puia sp.]|jgi:DNA repair protein RecO (recombination protein O)|nr:DNA repair protein RecO [Puia sp.]